MRESKEDLVKAIFKRDRIVTVKNLCAEIKIKEPMIRRYIGNLKALSSVNCNSKYYLLPDSSTFKESELIDVNGILFHKGGTLRSVVSYVVEQSPCGLQVGAIKEKVKTAVSAILPKMLSSSEVERKNISGVHGFIYLSTNPSKRKKQIKARKDLIKKQDDNKKLSEDFDADMIIDTLVTMIKKPDLAAKGVALSLQRRGKKITSDKVKEIVNHFDISKKNF
jgi:hypothetical protein